MPARPQSAFRRTLRAHNGRRLRIRLSLPAPGDACPLTLEPVADDELDFLPGVTFFEDLPRVRLATLPCRHAFGAMSLLYHFLRHNMLCPCCRAGPAARLDPACVPVHFRAALVARVAELETQDLRDQLHADAEVARAAQADADEQLTIDAITANLGVILGGRGVDLSVFAHDGAAPAYISFQFHLVPALAISQLPDLETTTQLVFEMPLHEHRRLTANLEEAAVGSLSFVVHGRSPANHVVELARTGPAPAVAADHLAERNLAAGASSIRLHRVHPTGVLSHVSWATPVRGLLPLLMG